ncbi:NAD+ synthase [Flavisolibacter ginsengisoli]|jgi:NAD+ synthase (glutamine-hydrolysing)|uniref:Glutamine-dependent NAD(+) synthetase n=1 Tax=Flavisolibacter ginsengisoli DSM 18119 TaxID=1121884 RepID=A0A1M4VX30_9BACT|nr:NAD+ synthase [Flavisolibacter ginsengisoli]SHE73517.1 NAD+ synthase (glutamine-hydrolysing) [Flavisolibacter ginsengisoli DSM 18119]
MKIFLAQQNYHIGNFEANAIKIIKAIEQAKKEEADLVLFSELCICGYPPRDFLEFEDFINECYKTIDIIKEHADTIGVLIGSPARNSLKAGKDLFNAAYLLYEKEIKAEIHKTLLPTYDVFDENRYFEPAFEWKCIEFKGKKLAVTICEDIWNLGDNPLYRVTPMEILIKEQPDVMLNLSASPYNYAADVVRRSIMKAHTLKYGLPMLYCNTVGSQTEVVFDGGSLIYDINGNLVKEMKYFQEDYAIFDLEILSEQKKQTSQITNSADLAEAVTINKDTGINKDDVFLSSEKESTWEGKYYYSASEVGRDMDTLKYLTDDKNIQEIHDALVLGIRDYFTKMGFTMATLGASGGIDSAVVQALAVEALGKENVHVLLMPSEYSSSHSVSDAEKLCLNLGNRYNIIPIKDVYQGFLSTLKPIFKDLPFSVAEENIQSRVRGNLLMAVANKFGYILLNTSNKSELATGYGTLYGDMAGGLSVLGDLYKMQVYALARYINIKQEIIPRNILEKAPSAELRPNQKDSDSLPDYEILDRLLFQYIELRQGPKEIIAQGFDPTLVKRVLRLVNMNEYKRNQFCPIIRVSSKAFGVGRRLPIVAKYLS